MAASSTRIYTDLDSSIDSIRVLVLEPGARDDSISCSLEVVELSPSARYEALSYVWGDASKRKDITVNGATIHVTENLEVALRHLRSTTKQSRLWVDAVCINQRDDVEKSRQIRMMAQIYATASEVLVWLGPEEGQSDRAMILLERMMTAVNEEERGVWKVEVPEFWNRMVSDLLAEWDALSATILSRPWWERAWTLQEFVVPKKSPLLICGYKSVSSYILDSLVAPPEGLELPELGPNMKNFRTNVAERFFTTTVFDMVRARRTYQEKGQISIMNMLARITTRKATDPRDRVFAYLGLMAEPYRTMIVPDYTKDKDTVFAEVIKQIISTEKRVDILSYSKFEYHYDRPTWVADFARSLSAAFEGQRFFEPGCYRASFDLQATVDLAEDVKFLSLKGFQVDALAQRSMLLYTHADRSKSKCISMCRELIDKWGQATGKSVEKMHDSLWRVLVADKDMDGATPAPESYKDMCQRVEYLDRVTAGDTEDLKDEDFDFVFGGSRDLTTILNAIGPFQKTMHRAVAGRVFIITDGGHMGLAPFPASVGDTVTILCGGDVPYILSNMGSYYQLVGECYLSDNMNGEIIKILRQDERYGISLDTYMTTFRLK